MTTRFSHILIPLVVALLPLLGACSDPEQNSGKKENAAAMEKKRAEASDIVIALDLSTSMKARDFSPDRLEVAKNLSKKFISDHPDDNIGIVVFAGEALVGKSITNDHKALEQYLDGLDTGLVEDGTAIGEGLASSINLLANAKAKNQAIILLTDGTNNMGFISPKDVAEIAKDKGIKIYTVAIGTRGMAEVPVSVDDNGNIAYEKHKVEIDETALKNIASQTGGKFFRVTDNNVFSKVFNLIDSLVQTSDDTQK